jgi:hypothetical protein
MIQTAEKIFTFTDRAGESGLESDKTGHAISKCPAKMEKLPRQ